MSWYDTALICLNGHVITNNLKTSPERATPHCSTCGEQTISKCPSCQSDIHGYLHMPNVVAIYNPEAPAFCHNCGVAYPWTKRKQVGINEIIDMNRKLSKEEKERLKMAIDDLVKETPRWRTASLELKGLSKKLGGESWDIMKPLLGDLLKERVKKALGF